MDFGKFHPGQIALPPGCSATWAGSIVRHEFDPWTPTPIPQEPTPNDEWFEWHSLLSAISEARDRFVMAEIGAGYGRWAVAGGVLARRIGLPASLICVEAEPTHFEMIPMHMQDNNIDPARHRLIQAAVTGEDGPVWFTVGRPRDWWGQSVLPSADYGFGGLAGVEPQELAGISLMTALDGVDRVDLIDMDIQGAEADVIEASLPLLRGRVNRLHIGTHMSEVEARIRLALADDFVPVWDFPCGQTVDTPVGRISFQDGVQAWVRRTPAGPSLRPS